MGCLAVLLTVFIGLPRTLVSGVDKNQADYAKLCDVYNLAVRIATETDKEVGENISGTIVDEITFLRLSSSSLEEANLTQSDRSKADSLKDQLQRLHGRRPTPPHDGGQDRNMALKLSHLERTAINTYNEMKQLQDDNRQKLQTAKTAATEAILVKADPSEVKNNVAPVDAFYGLGQKAWGSPGSLNNGKGCGNNGNGGAGVSLISDLTCLCLGRHGSTHTHAQKACSKGIDVGSGKFDSDASVLKEAAGWGVIKGDCEKRRRATTLPDSRELAAALTAYEWRIGAQGQDFVVGGSNVGAACDGTTSAQICINYQIPMTSGSNNKGFAGIPWVDKLLTAQQQLEEVEKNDQKYTEKLSLIKALNETAWSLAHARPEDASRMPPSQLTSHPSNSKTSAPVQQTSQTAHTTGELAAIAVTYTPLALLAKNLLLMGLPI